MKYILIFAATFFVWLMGSWHFNSRASEIYRKEISEPWNKAISIMDWPTCDRWKEAALNYHLHDFQHLLNPISWVKYWNWKPKP